MAGKFITLESSEGAGKGTAKEFIQDCMRAAGHEVTMTREPGGTPFAEKMREILLWVGAGESANWDLGAMEEILVLFAGRFNHLKRVINPHVEAGKIVISERFYDSTYAYQHYARGFPKEHIDALVKMCSCRTPDLTIYLDVVPEIGLGRATARGQLDRIEKESMDFFHRVRNGYLELAKEDPSGRWRIIDANKSIPEVRGQLLDVFIKENLMSAKAVNWIKGKYHVENC